MQDEGDDLTFAPGSENGCPCDINGGFTCECGILGLTNIAKVGIDHEEDVGVVVHNVSFTENNQTLNNVIRDME